MRSSTNTGTVGMMIEALAGLRAKDNFFLRKEKSMSE